TIPVSSMVTYNRSTNPKSFYKEAKLSISVDLLIEVHEVHVYREPRQFLVKLCMKMQERLAQRSKARNPHAGRRKGVHPGDQANTVLRLVGVQAQLLNRLA